MTLAFRVIARLFELNPEYVDMAERRIHADAPLFAEVA